MANIYRNILCAKGLTTIWDGKDFNDVIPSREEEYAQYAILDYDTTGVISWRLRNWGCDGRIFSSDTKEDTIILLTANATPIGIVEKLSSMLGDTVLEHEFSDQSNYNDEIYHLTWQNGKMIKGKKSVKDYETDEYNTCAIDITDIFDAIVTK